MGIKSSQKPCKPPGDLFIPLNRWQKSAPGCLCIRLNSHHSPPRSLPAKTLAPPRFSDSHMPPELFITVTSSPRNLFDLAGDNALVVLERARSPECLDLYVMLSQSFHTQLDQQHKSPQASKHTPAPALLLQTLVST